MTQVLGSPRFSSLYRSAPQLDLDQEPFWNAAVAGDWGAEPEELLERLLAFEATQGRERDPNRPKGPRVLDLDLLLCGDAVRDTPRLILPHPGLGQRRFALEPLVELLPQACDPRSERPWRDLLTGLSDQAVDRVAGTW